MPEEKELALLQKDISYLRETIDSLSTMVKEVIDDLRGRMSDIETSILILNEREPALRNRVDCLEVEVGAVKEKVPEDLHGRMKTLEKISTSIKPVIGILAFIGSTLLALVIGLIWAMITGSVTIQ